MKNIIHKNICFILIIALVLSCVNSEEYEKLKKDFRNVEYLHNVETFDSIYASIPNYSEISEKFELNKFSFNRNILLPFEVQEFNNSSKKTAILIGMYIADLGYVRHFERVQYCMDYLEVLKSLIHKMAVPVEDFNKMVPEFEKNINNKNRLFEITDSLMNTGNILLSDSEMYGASALVLGGLWVEALYIGLSYSMDFHDKDFNKSIKSHFELLKQINNLFDCFSDNSTMSDLKKDLKAIEINGYKNPNLLEDIKSVRAKYVD